MATYRISAEGRVLQPLHEDGELHNGFSSGPVARWRDVHFHGWLNFYTLVNSHPSLPWIGPDNPGEWHGYNAKFSDGQLVLIEMDEKTERSFAARSGEEKP